MITWLLPCSAGCKFKTFPHTGITGIWNAKTSLVVQEYSPKTRSMYSIGRKIETNSGAVEHDDETIDPKTCFSDVFFLN